MSYEIKKLEKSEVQITVSVTGEEMKKHRAKACEEISKDVKIKGFRPGNVPQDVLEKHIGKNHIDARARELAIQKSYADAVIAEKLQVIARPKVEIKKEEPLEYVATVAVMPEVELKDPQEIKVKAEEVKVTDKDVEEVLADLKKHSTTYKDVEREAKKGDRVEIDFEGFDEKGESVPNTKSANHPLIIGENTLIPGFEDELIGLKKGDEKEFDITFPNDYHKEDFQNKKMKFKTKLHRIEEAQEGDLNEETIEKITGKKQSVEDLKKEIEKTVKARKEQEAKQKLENDYLEELLKRTKVEVPDSLIDEEIDHIIHDMKHEVEHKGMKFDDFLAQSKIEMADLRKKYRDEAERRIKVRLAIQKLIDLEKITISNDEVERELEKIKSFYPQEQHEKIQQDFDKGELGLQIRNRLLIRKLFAKVLPS